MALVVFAEEAVDIVVFEVGWVDASTPPTL